MKLTILAAALLLAGCGGGGSSSAPSAPAAPIAPVARTAPLQFGYFGLADIANTAISVTFSHAIDWGNWNTDKEAIKARIIAQLQAAKAAGLSVIVSTGFLTFSADYKYLGTAELVAFKKQLDALDLSKVCIALYPIDEPDVHGISDSVMTQCFNETRTAWPGPAIAVVYGTRGTPGIAAADWVGDDKYREGPQFPTLRAGQRAITLPGGADPYRQDPAPFVAFAKAHAEVALVWAFLYVDYTGVNGEPEKGIGSNGLLASYSAAGTAIKGDS
jgi:hypothetical protein